MTQRDRSTVLCSDNAARRPRRAFSIVELLVVLTIIALLTALALPAITNVRRASRKVACVNNVRNLGIAIMQSTDTNGRFPAAGYFGRDPATGQTRNHHNWVVEILPGIEQQSVSRRWDKDKWVGDPANEPLTHLSLPVLICPVDISRSEEQDQGDLSYVVNGGVAFTVEYRRGMHDCFVDPNFRRLDLNGNGVLCPPRDRDLIDDGQPSDRKMAFALGLFFNETWKWDVTERHHRPGTVVDGLSQTILLTENVRTGYNPSDPLATWAVSNPLLTSFYIGSPCPGGNCANGVDYRLSNAGSFAINSGLWSPEGKSPVPNSFHAGGVNMVFGDGRTKFVSEAIDGAVYAALVSPAGLLLDETPLRQVIPPGDI